MICCQNTYNLCEWSTCESIEFGIATSTSTIKAHFTFANNTSIKDVLITNGMPYTLDLDGLNENACYTIRFKNLDGTKHIININGIDYDCFKLKTINKHEII